MYYNFYNLNESFYKYNNYSIEYYLMYFAFFKRENYTEI